MTGARGYETFEHTADIGIRAWGSNDQEVFEEAAKALFSVIVELSGVSVHQKLPVAVTAESVEDLFLTWLKELLFIFETKHLVLSEFKIESLSASALSARVGGEVLDPKRHALGREVKAVTMHQFKFIRESSRHFAEAILDI